MDAVRGSGWVACTRLGIDVTFAFWEDLFSMSNAECEYTPFLPL